MGFPVRAARRPATLMDALSHGRPMRCDEAAAALDELADLADLASDTFQARAYRRAARGIFNLEGSLEDNLANGKAAALPGVGEGILKKLKELSETGAIAKAAKYRVKVPAGVAELIRVPGVGPKRAMELHERLGIDSLSKLKLAAEQGKLAGLKGFGVKMQEDILMGLEVVDSLGKRLLLPEAHRAGEEVRAALAPHATRLEWAGSLRRRKDTVGDLDFVAVPKRGNRDKLVAALLAIEGSQAIAKGEEKVSVRLPSGLQVDLRLMDKEEFGAALVYFTGSKAHNIKLRALASKKDMRLNEYGLFQGREEKDGGKRIAGAEEEDIYKALEMPFIPPELREDQGEVEAGLLEELPQLIEEPEVLGDLHNHSSRSDGVLSSLEWVKTLPASGLKYIGLTDHSIGLPGWGLTGKQLVEHRADVLEMADKHAGKVKVFVGTEANIMKDGDLDLTGNELDELDYVVASVHTHFQMDAADMTKRIVKALGDGRIHILSHPTGRKIGRRPPLDFDRDAVFRAAAESKTCLELDAQPDRLDLNGELARRAKQLGCRFTIDSDNHGTPKREMLRWGVDQARRGWLAKGDVVNTLPAEQAMKALTRH